MGDCFFMTFHGMKRHDNEYDERNRMKYKFFLQSCNGSTCQK